MSNDTLTTGATRVDTASHTVSTTSRMSIALSGLVAQWLRGLTINAHERLAIAHLWEHGPMTMSELGARIPLSRAAVTALTDRLEALRYVQRTPDAHDRRRTVLTLTERPLTLIDDMVGSFLDEVSRVEEQFGAEELRVIERWNDSLRELAHRFAGDLRGRREDELPTVEAQ